MKFISIAPLKGKPRPYPQTLDEAGRLAKDEHASLLRKLVNCSRKSFIKLGPDTESCFAVSHYVIVMLSVVVLGKVVPLL